MEERLSRIKEMEEIQNSHRKALDAFNKSLAALEESEKAYEKLKAYYSSKAYFEDMESYDRGEIPEEVRCGVLSEDETFDLIGDNYQAAIKMLEVATEILKNH